MLGSKCRSAPFRWWEGVRSVRCGGALSCRAVRPGSMGGLANAVRGMKAVVFSIRAGGVQHCVRVSSVLVGAAVGRSVRWSMPWAGRSTLRVAHGGGAAWSNESAFYRPSSAVDGAAVGRSVRRSHAWAVRFTSRVAHGVACVA